MTPFFSTKIQVEKPIIDKTGSTHFSTHWKWFTPKGREEMLSKRTAQRNNQK